MADRSGRRQWRSCRQAIQLRISLIRITSTHKIQGRVRTQTDGLILNRVYQKIDATKKIAPMMYKSTSFCVLLPVSKVSWNEV